MTALSVTAPFFYRLADLYPATEAYPFEEINDHLRAFPDQAEAVNRTLAYFDPIHHAAKVTADTLVCVGDPGATGGPEWMAPLIQTLGGAVEQYVDHARGANRLRRGRSLDRPATGCRPSAAHLATAGHRPLVRQAGVVLADVVDTHANLPFVIPTKEESLREAQSAPADHDIGADTWWQRKGDREDWLCLHHGKHDRFPLGRRHRQPRTSRLGAQASCLRWIHQAIRRHQAALHGRRFAHGRCDSPGEAGQGVVMRQEAGARSRTQSALE